MNAAAGYFASRLLVQAEPTWSASAAATGSDYLENSDYRRTPTGQRFVSLLCYACAAGMSLWRRGFSQGKHRAHELLLEGNEPPKGRGKHKGWKPKPPR